MSSAVHGSEIIAKPFLRWAGGKSWLIRSIDQYLPSIIHNYYEPFLGGGSIFFHIRQHHDIKGSFTISDKNRDLVNCYVQVRDNVEKIIDLLHEYKNEKEFYYELRDSRPKSATENAARFIFLNRTSFNGIYRVNFNGVYNVPYGHKEYKSLFDYDNLRRASKLLANTEIKHQDFQKVVANLKENDLIILDPPYTVAHENNGFVKYNQKIFAWRDQKRLAGVLGLIIENRANFILTNASHHSIDNLFGMFGTKHELFRYSVIGGKQARRRIISEYLFHNYFVRE